MHTIIRIYTSMFTPTPHSRAPSHTPLTHSLALALRRCYPHTMIYQCNRMYATQHRGAIQVHACYAPHGLGYTSTCMRCAVVGYPSTCTVWLVMSRAVQMLVSSRRIASASEEGRWCVAVYVVCVNVLHSFAMRLVISSITVICEI